MYILKISFLLILFGTCLRITLFFSSLLKHSRHLRNRKLIRNLALHHDQIVETGLFNLILFLLIRIFLKEAKLFDLISPNLVFWCIIPFSSFDLKPGKRMNKNKNQKNF